MPELKSAARHAVRPSSSGRYHLLSWRYQPPSWFSQKPLSPGVFLPRCSISSEGQATLGASVFTAGYPRPTLQGVEPKFTDGTVSSLKGVRDEATNYQISVPLQPGNSGGALVHLQSGWVVGIVRAAFDPATAQNVNYAVKSTAARALVESTPAAKFILNIPAPRNPSDAGTTIEKVKSATVLVLIPR